jgi:hypothetical protein
MAVEPIAQFGIEPIYLRRMSPAAWQLLWWLISEMDRNCEIRKGWRNEAARKMKKDRFWLRRCEKQLLDQGLIKTERHKHWCKVMVDQIQG